METPEQIGNRMILEKAPLRVCQETIYRYIYSKDGMNRAFDIFSFNEGEVSRKTFDDIQGFRELIETGTASHIFDAVTPLDLAKLRTINQQMVQARSVVEASQFDLQFHTGPIALTDNKSILDIYGIMKPVILRIMQRGKTRRIIEGETFMEHEGILRAIEASDSLAYQYFMRTHLRASLATFVDHSKSPTAKPDEHSKRESGDTRPVVDKFKLSGRKK